MGILDIFEQFRDTIFLKEDSELQKRVIELENILEKNPKNEQLQQELLIAKKGLKGENEIAYQIKKFLFYLVFSSKFFYKLPFVHILAYMVIPFLFL